MLKVKEAIIVEGKYDKIKLSSIIDGLIIATEGFGIFKNQELLQFIRGLAQNQGIVIVTDSDKAGFKIRALINGAVDTSLIKNVYIPDISGKEKRKETASKEGLLGVEGMDRDIIVKAFERAGVLFESGYHTKPINTEEITISHLYEDGITGRENSYEKRLALLDKLNLPKRLSTKSLLRVLNSTMSLDEYRKLV